MSNLSLNKAIKKGQGRKADMTKVKRSAWRYRHHFLSRPPRPARAGGLGGEAQVSEGQRAGPG